MDFAALVSIILIHLQTLKLGPVVRKPINDNPRLKGNRGYYLARLEKSKVKGENLLENTS